MGSARPSGPLGRIDREDPIGAWLRVLERPFLQQLHGFTAWQTGKVILPGALASAFTMAFVGRNARRLDARYTIVIGSALKALEGVVMELTDCALPLVTALVQYLPPVDPQPSWTGKLLLFSST